MADWIDRILANRHDQERQRHERQQAGRYWDQIAGRAYDPLAPRDAYGRRLRPRRRAKGADQDEAAPLVGDKLLQFAEVCAGELRFRDFAYAKKAELLGRAQGAGELDELGAAGTRDHEHDCLVHAAMITAASLGWGDGTEDGKAAGGRRRARKWHFDPNQPRNSHGRWVAGAGMDILDDKDKATQINHAAQAFLNAADALKDKDSEAEADPQPPAQSPQDSAANMDYVESLLTAEAAGGGLPGTPGRRSDGLGGWTVTHPLGVRTPRAWALWQQVWNHRILTSEQQRARFGDLCRYMVDLALYEINGGDRPAVPTWLERYAGPQAGRPGVPQQVVNQYWRYSMDGHVNIMQANQGRLSRDGWVSVLSTALVHLNGIPAGGAGYPAGVSPLYPGR
jgi:hypothetical protein